MRITIVCVGKLKEKYWQDAIAEYSKRLSRYHKLEIVELPDEKAPETMSPAICPISNSPACWMTARCSFTAPVGYQSGISQPPKSTSVAPRASCVACNAV